MTRKKTPVVEEPAATEVALEPEAEPETEPEAEAEQESERGDPWEDACPVCGLKGCRRHV